MCTDGVAREMKAELGDNGVKMILNEKQWSFAIIKALLFGESEDHFQGAVDVFYSVCGRGNLRDVGTSKVTVRKRTRYMNARAN